MDFGALPPEVNSGRMYRGPGPASLLAASAGWEALAAEMYAAAGAYQSVIAALTDESWTGPSSRSMAAAVAPYLVWLRATAARCDEAASRATAAAAAFETAYAVTVPPPVIAANRVQLAALVASNIFGQNTPAIMATEAAYGEMWAQDASAMYGYAASSASAATLSAFAPPAPTTKPGGPTASLAWAPRTLQALATPGSRWSLAASPATMGAAALSGLAGPPGESATHTTGLGAQAAAQAAAAVTSTLLTAGTDATPEVGTHAFGLASDGFGLGSDISGIGLDLAGSGLEFAGSDSLVGAAEAAPAGLEAFGPLEGLGALADPWATGADGGAYAGLGQASSLGTLSVPPSWAEALSAGSTDPDVTGVSAGQLRASPSAMHAPRGAEPPTGGIVGRGSGDAVHRVGARASLIPRSPMAG